DWDHMTIREIDWALGACMMIRTEAVPDEVFDPRFFLYFEDVDLCLRLKKAGWKVVYHPEAAAVHEHRQKSRKNPFSRANYEHFKSWVKFILKYRNISGIE
ncbi:MAG: glycosyltransferase, partial [Nitrospirota bacterium]